GSVRVIQPGVDQHGGVILGPDPDGGVTEPRDFHVSEFHLVSSRRLSLDPISRWLQPWRRGDEAAQPPRIGVRSVPSEWHRSHSAMDSTHSLELGRRRFDDRIWDEAYESLRAAAEETALEAEDCERLATAAYLSGHDDESAAAWTSAHREWLQRSEFGSAIRCAFWLAFSLLQRGDGAQGGGWLARAGQLLEEHRLDTVEQGYLAIPPGMVALHSGELSDARTQFERVRDVARRFADADLAALATLGLGEVFLRGGERPAAPRELDQAMGRGSAAETWPTEAGIISCAVIAACQQAPDLRRADEWTTALDRWCARQPGLVPYRGRCRVH